MSRKLSDIVSDEILALPTGQRKKAALAALREAEAPEIAAEKEKTRRERRCFWTWPFGHAFVTTEWYSTIPNVETCVGCGKRRKS